MNLPFTLTKEKKLKSKVPSKPKVKQASKSKGKQTSKPKVKSKPKVNKKKSQKGGDIYSNFALLKKNLDKKFSNKSKVYNTKNYELIPASQS